MTGQAKHTPGGWKQSEHRNIGWALIEPVKGGAAICKILSRHPTGQRGRGDFEEEEANARLIAASPALLEACKYVVKWHRDHDSGSGELFGLDFVTTCIAAIAKAEGRT